MTSTAFTVQGVVIGLLLTLAILTGGVIGFLLAIVLGAIGIAVGAHFDGLIDLTALRKSGRN